VEVRPYYECDTDGPITHEVMTRLTAREMVTGSGQLVTFTVWPSRWLPDDDAVVTSRDGQVFKGKVADIEMWTGRLVIQLT
jgi:hypothetical protein